MLCHNPYCFPSQSQAIFQIGADCPNSIKDLTATWGSAIRQNLGWKCGLGKKTIFGIVMTKVRSVGFSRERSENAGSKAPGGGGGGYSHTLPIRVCAAQRGCDFEAPNLERGIHFRGVF